MTFSPRRKPLTLIICCGLAGSLAATLADQAKGQGSAPFRVDPTLLGLPPLKPASPPAVAPVARPTAESRPVEAPAVETRTLQTAVDEPQKAAAESDLSQPAAAAAPLRKESVSPVVGSPPPVRPETVARPQTETVDPVVAVGADAGSTAVPAVAVPPTQASAPARPAPQSDATLRQPAEDAATASAVEGASQLPAGLVRQPVESAGVSPPQPPTLMQPAIAESPREGSAVPSVSSPGPEGASIPSGPAPRLPGQAASAVPASAVPATDEQGAADDLPLSLRVARAMVPPPIESKTPRPVFVSGLPISGTVDREVVTEDDAELRKVGKVVTADRLTYWPIDDEVEGVGSVRLQLGDDVISGPKGRLKLEDEVGFFDQATYFMKRQRKAAIPGQGGKTAQPTWLATETDEESRTGFAAPRVLNIKPGQTKLSAQTKPLNQVTEARGEATRIDFEGVNQRHLTDATYTTCKPGNDDWYLRVADLKLDYDNDVANGNDATVEFLGVPILHSPWVSFSLNNERKSGFLTPRYGSSSDSGFEFVLPYYWNIAPNMDATIDPRVLSRRGLQFGTTFRYLDTLYGAPYSGIGVAEYLPHDRETNTDRWGVALTHSQAGTLSPSGFSGSINYARVSDNKYYTDLSSQITSTSKTQVLQQGVFSYGGAGWWSATTILQAFQTLQPDPKNPVARPYRLLPQLVVNARQPDLFYTDSSFFGQYTDFVHPDASKVEGQRTVLQPQISLPYVTPGWYVTPRVGVNVTHYALTNQIADNALPSSITRTLPIASVDSGMTFERSTQLFGRDYTQTLEPRLFYLNIPYENQNNIPIFDTGLADFNFAQIFADNQFSGWDRINNANQLTTAVASRLIDPSNGTEIMRAMIGEVFYFANNKVVLPGTTNNRKWDKSDFLAAFSGQLLPRVYADAAVQYDINDQRFQRYTVGARYQPGPGRILNASYRYNIDASTPINEIDISGQWPITPRWQAVGRYNYSYINTTPIEIIGGLEYNAGCWALRTVAHRILTAQATSTTQFFMQLELNGLSSAGTNPLTLLQRRIPGYAAGAVATDQALAEW